MKITDTAMALSGTHRAYASQTSEVEVQTKFTSIFSELSGQASESSDKQAELRRRVARMLDSIVSTILAALDGKKCPEDLAADTLSADGSAPTSGSSHGSPRELAWQVTTEVSQTEFEATTVSATGTVQTADGRSIDFKVGLAMERGFHQLSRIDEAGNVVLKDPLVINFAGQACELTDERISFDLDADGQAESLPGLGKASGYLVLDRNGNGVADDGRELLGAQSGDGFADLAALDEDGNGWVDEGDAAFGQLSVWSGGKYQSLAERGVGALYTGAVASPFALKDRQNHLLGEIRAAGVYLAENGQAGTLQQVDLALDSSPVAEPQPKHGQALAA